LGHPQIRAALVWLHHCIAVEASPLQLLPFQLPIGVSAPGAEPAGVELVRAISAAHREATDVVPALHAYPSEAGIPLV
jgi:hypothetical protein